MKFIITAAKYEMSRYHGEFQNSYEEKLKRFNVDFDESGDYGFIDISDNGQSIGDLIEAVGSVIVSPKEDYIICATQIPNDVRYKYPNIRIYDYYVE